MRTAVLVIAGSILLGIGALAAIEYVYTPNRIAQGFFHSVAHKGSGAAALYRLPGGRRSLRLINFNTSMRPDLTVYLISAADAFDNETVATSSFISLGPLKDAAVEQVYEVPPGIDLSRYHAVTIWSRKYAVNFTTAPLR